jgi:hypothetical protein
MFYADSDRPKAGVDAMAVNTQLRVWCTVMLMAVHGGCNDPPDDGDGSAGASASGGADASGGAGTSAVGGTTAGASGRDPGTCSTDQRCPVCDADQTCYEPSHTANGDGTVTSSCCGLTWQQQVEGAYRWAEAQAYCENLNLADGGWRLPAQEELVSLVDLSRPNPTIDRVAFPDTPTDFFWSSAAAIGSSGGVWGVDFRYGSTSVHEPDTLGRARCVR